MKTIDKTKKLFILVFLFCSFSSMADIGEADETVDEEDAALNPAPIDQNILPLLIVGAITGWYLVRRKILLQQED